MSAAAVGVDPEVQLQVFVYRFFGLRLARVAADSARMLRRGGPVLLDLCQRELRNQAQCVGCGAQRSSGQRKPCLGRSWSRSSSRYVPRGTPPRSNLSRRACTRAAPAGCAAGPQVGSDPGLTKLVTAIQPRRPVPSAGPDAGWPSHQWGERGCRARCVRVHRAARVCWWREGPAPVPTPRSSVCSGCCVKPTPHAAPGSRCSPQRRRRSTWHGGCRPRARRRAGAAPGRGWI